MSIIHPIPKSAKFSPTANVFSAPFSLGIYDFTTAANVQRLFKMIPNTVYFLDNFSFAGNLSKEDFLAAIDLTLLPTITITKKSDKTTLYDKPIILSQFYEDKPATAFLKSQQANDEAIITLSARLFQIAPLIGLNPMLLTVSFNCFYMDDNEYNKNFADSMTPQFSRKLR